MENCHARGCPLVQARTKTRNTHYMTSKAEPQLSAPWSALFLSNHGHAALDVFAGAAANKLLLAVPRRTPFHALTNRVLGKVTSLEEDRPCNGSSDSTQIVHQCDQNFNDSQMYISAVNFPLVFMFSVRRQMSPVSARRVAFVFRDFPIGFI